MSFCPGKSLRSNPPYAWLPDSYRFINTVLTGRLQLFRRKVGINRVISRIQSLGASKSLVVCSVVEDRYQSEKVLPGVIYPGVRDRLRIALE